MSSVSSWDTNPWSNFHDPHWEPICCNKWHPGTLNWFQFCFDWFLHSNFVECEYFLEPSSPNILTVCETNLDDSIDSGNFSVRGYLPLIRNDSITHMHSLAVYVKKWLPFSWDLSLKNCGFLLMFSASFTSFNVFFFFYWSP